MTDPIQPLVDEIMRRLNVDTIKRSDIEKIKDNLKYEILKDKERFEKEIKEALKDFSSVKKEITIIDKRCSEKEIKKDIGKQHLQFPLLLSYMNIGLHTYIHGPTGSGKTQGLIKVAESLGLTYYRIALCSQTSKSELLGYNDAHGNYVPGIAYEPYVNGGLLILDELDNGNANVNSVLNILTDGGDCVFPCGRRNKHKDFYVGTTANTIGNGATRQYVGRSPQDKALLNRLVNIFWGYDKDFEKELAWVEYKSYGGKDEKDFNKKLNDFWHMRNAIEELKLDHILSTRNLIQSMRMIAAGIDFSEITRSVISRGLEKDQFRKILDKANELKKNCGESNVDIKEDKPLTMEVVVENNLSKTAPF